MTTLLVAVDGSSRDVTSAEHLVRRLDALLPGADHPSYAASTHVVVTSAGAHVAVAASWTVALEDATPDGLLALLADGLPEAGVVVELEDRTTTAGPAELAAGARAAAIQHRDRSAGRLARFPGQRVVHDLVTVSDVVRLTCVDQVVGLAGVEVSPATVLDLGDFVRPTWGPDGCTVLVQAGAGAPIPFEVRDQVACCSDH
jgi:hypothetical protein